MTVGKRARAICLAAAVAAGTCLSAGIASATTGPSPHVLVNVTLTESRIVLNKQAVKDVTYVDFLVRNAGKVPRVFEIGGLSTKALKPGQRVHLFVGFPVFGKYPYHSTAPTVKAKSLHGRFTVDQPQQPD